MPLSPALPREAYPDGSQAALAEQQPDFLDLQSSGGTRNVVPHCIVTVVILPSWYPCAAAAVCPQCAYLLAVGCHDADVIRAHAC